MKKRKVAKATGAASKQRRQNEKRSSAPKRVVSDGMLITKPGVSAFKQPRDPQLQNSHTPDALQLNLGDPRVMNDRVPVVAPFTSMDIISARPSSNMTLQNMAMYSSPSQQDTHNSTESFKTNPLNTTPNTIDDFITRSKAHHADDRLMVRPRRAVDVSQNMCLVPPFYNRIQLCRVLNRQLAAGAMKTLQMTLIRMKKASPTGIYFSGWTMV